MAEWGDCIQIGARNMQNYSLLKTVGRLGKPGDLTQPVLSLRAHLEHFSPVYAFARGVGALVDHSRIAWSPGRSTCTLSSTLVTQASGMK